jgi:hypothetical protein
MIGVARVRAAMHSFYITQSYQPRDGHDEYAELIPFYPEIVMNRLQDEWMTRVGTTPQ